MNRDGPRFWGKQLGELVVVVVVVLVNDLCCGASCGHFIQPSARAYGMIRPLTGALGATRWANGPKRPKINVLAFITNKTYLTPVKMGGSCSWGADRTTMEEREETHRCHDI